MSLVALAGSTLAIASGAASQQLPPFENLPSGGTVPAGSVSGMAAIRAMGDSLAEVAAAHNFTAAELADALRTDRSLYVTPARRLVNVCPPAPQALQIDNAEIPGGGGEGDDNPTSARYFGPEIPLEDFLNLESRPGSTKTVYLDFDGYLSQNNSWGHNINFPPYNTQGGTEVFTDQERSDIIEHWKEVAEDFANLDVNVTTKDPGVAALVRSNSGDQRFGIRVVMTQPTGGFGNGIGGVAFLNSFNDGIDNPCFGFNKGLGSGPMTASHEAGHTFGLRHDGLENQEYHPGARGNPRWGPIMGAPFGRTLVQWSIGDYPGATQFQDDYAVMTNNSNRINFLPDDHPDSPTSGTRFDVGTPIAGVINNRFDIDSFEFTVAEEDEYTISVTNADRGPNLDAAFTLYRASPFELVGTTDPETQSDAVENYILTPGDYTIVVDGTFNTVTSGPVSDYGSVGGFQIDIAPFVPPPPPQPLSFAFPGEGLPTELTAGEPTTISVVIDPGDDGPINESTAFAFYGFDTPGQPFLPSPLVAQGNNLYTTTIPAGQCGQLASVYFTINNSLNTRTFTAPEDPTSPFTIPVEACDTGPDCLADANGDGLATPADFTAWVLAFNTGAPACDQNGDTLCTPADFTAWVLNFNAGCP
ncbi:MAG: hypothetical protein AAFR96_10715 [Planctomycetota bacterium]